MPRVTVLMAVYNGDRYLREVIDSILSQTFLDYEFLIVNDGSTDNSREIIISYDDPRIRLIDNERNLGLTRSLNKGLKLAQGEFIARQDADDISDLERLAKQVAFLDENPNVALLGTWYKEIDAQGNSIGDGKLPCDYTQIRWHLLFYCPFVHSAVMLRKSIILEKIGLYNETLTYSMDYELWNRIACHLPVANLNECLVKLRINPWSMTETYGDRTLEGFRIRIATISQLLNWNKHNVALNKQLFNNMFILLFGAGSQPSLSAQDVKDALKETLRLHTVFCQIHKIDQKKCRVHLISIHAHISHRLMEFACSHLQENSCFAWQYLIQAYRLNWPILFTKKNARLVFNLLK